RVSRIALSSYRGRGAGPPARMPGTLLAVIRCQGVTKSFGGRAVLDGLDCTIAAGTIWGLIGPGAAGKSLLCKLLVGLQAADAGRIFVGDDEVSALGEDALMRVRARFGMLFQN